MPQPSIARLRRVVVVAAGVGALLACSAPPPAPPVTGPATTPGTAGSSTVPTITATSGSQSGSTSDLTQGGPGPTTTRTATRTATPTATSTGTSTGSPGGSCASRIVAGLSASERAGQLLMVGLDVNAGRSSLDRLIAQRHLGGVILLGGWYDGARPVRQTTSHLAGLASGERDVGLLLAADQEGGAVQQLRGPGFTRFGSARVQNQMTPAQLTAAATGWAQELRAAGINVNLAPVADTVPTSIGTANDPIGQWGRQFSSDPDRNATMAGAFVEGMHRGGVRATVKHFPGIGRITGNTDLTASGITDDTTTADDPYLRAFAGGIDRGADLVMVGSAFYSRIDPGVNAVFSAPIITGMLRERLGFDGVVITDDVGAARAVSAVPVGQRAVRFVAAGGDIVLTARPDTVAAMHGALTDRMQSDARFAQLVEAATRRVVALKVDMGLVRCS